jgi:hypothetical protein
MINNINNNIFLNPNPLGNVNSEEENISEI